MIWLANCKAGTDADARVCAAEDVADDDNAVLFLCCIVTDRDRLQAVLLLHASPPVEPQPSRRTRSRLVFDREAIDDVTLTIALLLS